MIDDARVAATGQRDEARQDLALSQLVLGSADHEEVAGPGLPGARASAGMSRA